MVEAFNEMDAAARIKQNCRVVLKLTPMKDKTPGFLNMELGGARLNDKAFTVMCSQFSIILKAGIPIARTTHLIADKTTDKPLKKMLESTAEDVEAGRSLAASMAERGNKLLPTTFIETVRAGEESGNIDKSFETMYLHYDKQTKMRAKVRGALSYPIFVTVIAVVVVMVLMIKVVPTFIDVFASYGSDLPAITKLLIAISNFFRAGWPFMVAAAAGLALAHKLYGSTEQGRLNLARASLKTPVLGNIHELNAASQFANTMTTMLSAGLPLTKALSITANVLDNYYIGQEIGKLTGKLSEGHALGTSMREANCMPDILTDMVAVGEETGELEQTLRTIAKYYDAELDMAIAGAMAKLEPTLLLFIAGVAGFIVIAIYMTMFQMYAVM